MIVCRTNDGQIVGRTQGGAYWYIVHTYTCSGDANVLASPLAQNQLLDGLRGHWYVNLYVRLMKTICVAS